MTKVTLHHWKPCCQVTGPEEFDVAGRGVQGAGQLETEPDRALVEHVVDAGIQGDPIRWETRLGAADNTV